MMSPSPGRLNTGAGGLPTEDDRIFSNELTRELEREAFDILGEKASKHLQ